MKKPHAHFQSYIKTCVKFQKDQPKTVRGVALTRYLLHRHFNRNLHANMKALSEMIKKL